jgi:hypothetical protein
LTTELEEMEISFRHQPFYVGEEEMELSFDGFVSKIQEVFEGLPDPRKFSPHRRYSSLLKDVSIPGHSPRTMKDAGLGAFALAASPADTPKKKAID